MHVAVGLVSAGLGVAIVPASIQLLAAPGVVYRPLKERGATAQLAIAHASDNDSPVIPTFREVAAEVISSGIEGVRQWRAARAAGIELGAPREPS
jgi:DNA-binding transcriptional LysR family regulator